MSGCGGCGNRQAAISRLMQRAAKGNVSPVKAASYVVKSGARDLSRLAQASLNKVRRPR